MADVRSFLLDMAILNGSLIKPYEVVEQLACMAWRKRSRRWSSWKHSSEPDVAGF